MLLMTLLERSIWGDMAMLIEVPIATNDEYNDCCNIFGITCQGEDSSCVASVVCWLSDGTQTGILVDKGTYGLCIMAGGQLWSTGSLLSEKLLGSLVSAIATWLRLSHTNWVAFCQSFTFILLSLQC